MSFTIAYLIIGLSFALGWIIEYYDNLGEFVESIKLRDLKDPVQLIFIITLVILAWPVILFTADKELK